LDPVAKKTLRDISAPLTSCAAALLKEGEGSLSVACRQAIGKEHPDTLINMWCLADLFSHLDRHDEAILLYEPASTRLVAALGTQHPRTVQRQQQFRDAKG
jgi:hypothetical protein